MPLSLDAQNHSRRHVRLKTLVRLRWLAVIGQTTAVLVVYYGLEFKLPLVPCLAVIATAALLNAALRLSFPSMQRLPPPRAGRVPPVANSPTAGILFLPRRPR